MPLAMRRSSVGEMSGRGSPRRWWRATGLAHRAETLASIPGVGRAAAGLLGVAGMATHYAAISALQ